MYFIIIFIDFLKKFNFVFLLIYDQKSKWIDVKLMNKGTNASETIAKLKEVFSIFGLPAEHVSGGGPLFHSADFISFCQSNGITPIKCPPGHPPSNRYAERGMQIVKRNLEKALFAERGERITEEQILLKLSSFLFLHRSTPTVSTDLSPSKCILKLKPRTRFDLLKLSSISNQTKSGSLEAPRVRKLFRLNEIVYVKNKETKLWEKGKILNVLCSCTYLVQVGSNVKFLHSDSIKSDKSTSVLSDVDLSAQISNTTSDTVNGKQGTQCVSDSIPQNVSPNISREMGATHGVHLEENDSGSANVSCDSAKKQCNDLPTTCANQPCSSPKSDISVKVSRFGRAIKLNL
nr:unnamed protein product [Callosobruchus analis]